MSRRNLYLYLFMVMIVCLSVTIISGCKGNSNKDTFAEVGQKLSNSIKEIDKHPGIILSGFAADQNEKIFKVGIEYDQSQINNEQLKQIVADYLSHAASNSPPANDWKEMLKPFQLRIEKLGDAKKWPVIAEKDIGTTELKWKE
ncbi:MULTISPECIES: hypothetical protein [Paenibacillus]|uniref:Uncharacterized protein n=1 Tax=Paenibacillus albilobatus TaxID=2716884 RepID=A0A919XE13_9BACL|nr:MULTISPECIES: hypothetical protein [Paenibacillus]GIO29280.1 hypothetical protein J2TS6_04210 [Paenibacillus albilobatus]